MKTKRMNAFWKVTFVLFINPLVHRVLKTRKSGRHPWYQKSLLVYKNQHIKESTSYYSPNETTIEQTQCVKDLGIKMSVILSFTDSQFHRPYVPKLDRNVGGSWEPSTLEICTQWKPYGAALFSHIYRLLLTTIDPPQNWKYPKNWIPHQIFLPPN